MKILTALSATLLIGLGLLGCTRSAPLVQPEDHTLSLRATASSLTTSPRRLTDLQGGAAPSPMSASRLFFVAVKENVTDLAATAEALAQRWKGTRTELYPELKAFVLRTPGRVLSSDILHDTNVKFVWDGESHAPAAAPSVKPAAKENAKPKSTAASKTAKKTTQKSAKQNQTKSAKSKNVKKNTKK